MKLLSLVFAASLSLGGSSLWAAFTGDFDLGAPTNQSASVSGGASFGTWQATSAIVSTASTVVDTTLAPNQLTLEAAGGMDGAPVSIGELTFSSGVFSSDTTVSFDVLVVGSRVWTASFSYNGASEVLAAGADNYSFVVNAGSTLRFELRATGQGMTSVEDGGPGGGLGDDPGMGVEGYPSDVSVVISNFTATSVIPEPSVFAFLFGGLALAVATFTRRRRG